MKAKCDKCGTEFDPDAYAKCPQCEENEKRRREEETNQPGTVGLGYDPSCGKIEPTINLGGGVGLGFDGDLTI